MNILEKKKATKVKKEKKEKKEKIEEEFPFNNQYYDLIKGQTLSKRGVWWTALLLVQTKPNESDEEEDTETKTDEKISRKIIIQRWRRFKQGEDGFRWNKSKDFTITSKKQWNELKGVIEGWIGDESWI